MANSNNVYSTAKPLEGSNWIRGQEQMDFAYREEQRKIDAIEEAKKEKDRLKNDALRQKLLGNLPQNYNTGSASLNSFQAGIILKGVNRLGDIYKQLKDPSLSDNERIDLEIEAKNIQSLPENLKVATENFSNIIKDYRQGVDDGTYFRNPDFESKVLSGFDNYVGDLDNGLPVVGFMDKNGDGQMDVMPYDNLQNGIGVWSFQKQYDLDKLAQETGLKLGTEEVQTDQGYVKRYTKTPNRQALSTVTDNILQNSDGSPTEAALSEMRKRGLPINQQSLEQVKSIFKDRVLAYTDTSNKTDYDYSARNQDMQEARLQSEAKKGKAGDKEYNLNDLKLTANTVQQKGDTKERLTNIYQGNVDIKREAGKAVESFRSFATDKNGNVIVTVDVATPNDDGGSEIETKKYSSDKNADIVSYFAQRFKDPDTGEFIETVPQLKEKLSSLGEAKLGEPGKKKIAGF